LGIKKSTLPNNKRQKRGPQGERGSIPEGGCAFVLETLPGNRSKVGKILQTWSSKAERQKSLRSYGKPSKGGRATEKRFRKGLPAVKKARNPRPRYRRGDYRKRKEKGELGPRGLDNNRDRKVDERP